MVHNKKVAGSIPVLEPFCVRVLACVCLGSISAGCMFVRLIYIYIISTKKMKS